MLLLLLLVLQVQNLSKILFFRTATKKSFLIFGDLLLEKLRLVTKIIFRLVYSPVFKVIKKQTLGKYLSY